MQPLWQKIYQDNPFNITLKYIYINFFNIKLRIISNLILYNVCTKIHNDKNLMYFFDLI